VGFYNYPFGANKWKSSIVDFRLPTERWKQTAAEGRHGGARHGERHSNKQSKKTCGQLIEALSRHKMFSPSTRLLVLCSLAYPRKLCREVGEGGTEGGKKKTQPAGIACRREGSSKRPGGCCNVLGGVIGLLIPRVFVGCNNVLVLLPFFLSDLVACFTLSIFVPFPQI
jgi:hypothetical protein